MRINRFTWLFLLPALLCACGENPGGPDTPSYLSKVWSPDNGDGTYTNPVLHADYSDPDVCVVGEDYYLTASSFNCVPGLPVLHSRDLVNWEIIGHALQRLPAEFDVPVHGGGVWAPSIRYHDGRFYIYWGDPDRGIFAVTAEDPAGRWSDAHCVVEGKGMIDPCPLWDEDGRCYLVNAWANSRVGFNSILTVRELSEDGMTVKGDPRIVFDGGQHNHTAEGPKFYRKDGYYWIFCPAGGVKEGWQLAMRSSSVYGPYEARTVLSQGSTDIHGPHQGAWVHTSMGEDWFLHFNDRYAYGRVVFLEPMVWKDAWPLIGEDPDGDGCGQPVLRHAKPLSDSAPVVNPAEDDEFSGTLGLQWQWPANYDQSWGMPSAEGYYRLYNCDLPSGNLWDAPNLLLQKLPAGEFVATARMRIAAKCDGEYGGLAVMGRDWQALLAELDGGAFRLQLVSCTGADKGNPPSKLCVAVLKPSAEDSDSDYSPAKYLDIFMRIAVSGGRCRFGWSLDGEHFETAPGMPFTMKEGRWIGAKMGFVSEAEHRSGGKGWVDADWFRVCPGTSL